MVWGFLKLESLKSATARVRCYDEGPDVAGLTFLAVGTGANNARIDVKMYRIPAAENAFITDTNSLARGGHPWPLPGGVLFQQKLLAPTGVPETWKHRAVQTFASIYGIVHAWRGSGRAMLMRDTLPSNEMLDHPLFVWAQKNLHVIEAAWLLEPPGVSVAGA